MPVSKNPEDRVPVKLDETLDLCTKNLARLVDTG